MANWHEGLDDEQRAYVVSKGWDKLAPDAAAAAIAKSYRELDGLRGRSIVLPEKDEELDTVFKHPRLEAALTARETARRKADAAAATALQTQRETEQQAALDAAWGADKEKRSFLASKAAEALGWDADTLKAMLNVRGIDKGMNDLYGLGTKMGEGALLRGSMSTEQPKTQMSRADALIERNRLMTDKNFGAQILSNDPEVAAKAQKVLEEINTAIIGTPQNWQPAPRNFGRTHDNPRGE